MREMGKNQVMYKSLRVQQLSEPRSVKFDEKFKKKGPIETNKTMIEFMAAREGQMK